MKIKDVTFIYVISAGNQTKVGKANDPAARCKMLREPSGLLGFVVHVPAPGRTIAQTATCSRSARSQHWSADSIANRFGLNVA